MHVKSFYIAPRTWYEKRNSIIVDCYLIQLPAFNLLSKFMSCLADPTETSVNNDLKGQTLSSAQHVHQVLWGPQHLG